MSGLALTDMFLNSFKCLHISKKDHVVYKLKWREHLRKLLTQIVYCYCGQIGNSWYISNVWTLMWINVTLDIQRKEKYQKWSVEVIVKATNPKDSFKNWGDCYILYSERGRNFYLYMGLKWRRGKYFCPFWCTCLFACKCTQICVCVCVITGFNPVAFRQSWKACCPLPYKGIY